jgi:hypothetical protein
MRLAKPWSRGHWRRPRHKLPQAVPGSAIEGGSQVFTNRASLLRGLEPYRDGQRASVRKWDVLPHFPPVLHRGGYPDGR